VYELKISSGVLAFALLKHPETHMYLFTLTLQRRSVWRNMEGCTGLHVPAQLSVRA